MKFIEIAVPEWLKALLQPGTRAFRSSHCQVFFSCDPHWHISIWHPHRYPNWDEIMDARYQLVPDRVTMAMILPPKADYINIAEHCFHLHEWRPADGD